MTPHVTLVVATYRRVEALRATIRSVLLQTHGDWTALVVGDRCGEETADALRAFRDPRIRYYDLTERFGEQSGPNSAGLHLASGDFVAFLNHDDLLLPDHLEHGIERLAGADLCFGRYATAEVGEGAPVFTSLGPRGRDLGDLVIRHRGAFDPSSFWLVRAAYAKAVGPWRRAREVRGTPLRDWLLRAWRLRGRFRFGERVTGLRLATPDARGGGPRYDRATPQHEALAALLERDPADRVRALVLAQVEGAGGTRPRPRRPLARLRRRVWAALYLRFGIDREALVGPLRGRRKGAVLEELSRKRTGAPLPAEASLDAFLRDPEACRVL